jgi:methyltransferase
MVSRWIFSGFVVLVGLQRLLEVRLSRRNERRIRAAGGVEFGAGQYPWMVLLHSTWLVAMIGEVFLFNRAFIPALAWLASGLFGIGQVLRYSAILALGWRWNVRVLVIPGSEKVAEGIYRFIRHPNYLGVILEIFSAPLIHGAVFTSIFYSLANALFLNSRIKVEEKALFENSINAHSQIINQYSNIQNPKT